MMFYPSVDAVTMATFPDSFPAGCLEAAVVEAAQAFIIMTICLLLFD